MAQDKTGDSFSQRLASRGADLHRRHMPDGGEAFTGRLAQDALNAVGARAMTMDSTIIMGEGTDMSNPEDLALYAHEKHHAEHSGGEHGSNAHDTEEREARQIEGMVFHRSKNGESAASILEGLGGEEAPEPPSGLALGNSGVPYGGDAGPAPTDEGGAAGDPMEAYHAMIAEGKCHDMIVRQLADHVLDTVLAVRQSDMVRASDDDYRGV